MNIEQCIVELNALHMPTRPQGRNVTPMPFGPRSEATDPSAAVVDSTVVAFVDGISPANKGAVQNITLLAQMSADATFPEENQRVEWYSHYVKVMKMGGFIVTNNPRERYTPRGLEFEVNEVVLELISAIAGPNKGVFLRLAGTTLDALRKNDGARLRFERKSVSQQSSNFQIMPCAESAEGNLVCLMACFNLVRKETSSGFWFVKWKNEHLDVHRSLEQMELNYSHYQRVKAIIEQKLFESAEDFFENLPL
ncbi:hypothetical protein SOM59_10050 [Pseudomonas coleopterorum]|uniref:hypothetical protein n=1 Tax=Pseudomonas coleopterorum TaxID=1605838 RepID=UPI0017842516|nr:hypothetical protein [Pseudomonas coleopterorum]MBD8482066.1 hypothetical protein [Pseudomonas coleopterorum]MDY1017438.1 hypothetical protein [Pseudomonas coleopterorum]